MTTTQSTAGQALTDRAFRLAVNAFTAEHGRGPWTPDERAECLATANRWIAAGHVDGEPEDAARIELDRPGVRRALGGTTHMRPISQRPRPALPAGTPVEFEISYEHRTSVFQSSHAPLRGQVWSAAPGARMLWIVLPDRSCRKVRATECRIVDTLDKDAQP